SMIGCRRLRTNNAAPWVLAAAVLAHAIPAAAIDGIAPRNSTRLTWAPSRDEALVVDNSSNVQQVSGEADESIVSRSPRLAQRPRGLSRPAPWENPVFLSDGSSSGESISSVGGTPLSPDGLPVPDGIYYDD